MGKDLDAIKGLTPAKTRLHYPPSTPIIPNILSQESFGPTPSYDRQYKGIIMKKELDRRRTET